MPFTDQSTEFIPVELPNGTVIKVEVSQLGRENVASVTQSFKQVTDALEGIVASIAETVEKVKPDKASVKFGLEVGFQAGNLTAMIVKGSSKGNLEIELEWKKPS